MFDIGSRIAKRVADARPSGIRKFFDLVSEVPDIISLGVGEPDFVTPWSVRDAAIKSIQQGYTRYTSNQGLPELRREIARYLHTRIGLEYDPKTELLVTVGASEAIDIALRALIEPGDEILIPEPSYVSYFPCVTIAGGTAVAVKTELKDEFKLKVEELERAITPKTKALILPYPNNPTGGIMTREDLERLVPVIIKHGLVVISDEIYSELCYGVEHVSIASLEGMRDRTILINGFSKAFAMTGWRLGYVAAPEAALKQMTKIHQYTIMCAPTFSQHAAVKALAGGAADGYAEVAAMRDDYDRRRRLMVHRFNEMGLKCFEPKGSFYVFPSVEALGMDGTEFATRLLKEAKVAVVPGDAFGEFGKYHIRACYATGMKSLNEALNRIQGFIESLK